MAEIMTVHGDLELVARAGHLFSSAREEFLCAARDLDTWSQPEARAAVRVQMQAPGGTLAVRKLLSPVALITEESRRHLRTVSDHGAEVRIATTALPHETIIIDRRILILADADTRAGAGSGSGSGRDSGAGSSGADSAPGKDREYTVTTTATLVAGVHALFQAAWDTATDFHAFLHTDRPHLDSDGRMILRSLGSGLTDESAARRLGLSLRTYRRRVADLLIVLDADSRFQAGLRAGELGITG
jgi:hypothetical protein